MIVYRDHLDGVEPDMLRGFFVGWPVKPSPTTLLAALGGSGIVALAVDSETNRVVGFANALTDGRLAAFIPLLEVLPEYQARGVGSELVRRLLERLGQIYAVDVVCDPDVQPFYSRLGFTALHAMARRNPEAIARANGRADAESPSS